MIVGRSIMVCLKLKWMLARCRLLNGSWVLNVVKVKVVFKHSPAVPQEEEVIPFASISLLPHWATVEDVAVLGRASPPRVQVCDSVLGIAHDLLPKVRVCSVYGGEIVQLPKKAAIPMIKGNAKGIV